MERAEDMKGAKGTEAGELVDVADRQPARRANAVSRYALALFLFVGHAALVTAVTATLVRLAAPSREPHARSHLGTGPVAASRARVTPPETSASLGALGGDAPSPPGSTPSPRRERVSPDDAPDAAPPPALAVLPPPDDGAPEGGVAPAAAVQSSSDDEVAALGQLVKQSRLRSELLGQIDEHVAALRRQAASDGSRRQGEAEQKAARHAATIAALGTLRQAEAQIATGNSDGVDDDLGNAEAALSGRTRLDVEAAREALARGDLFQAGQYLAVALAERRTPR